MKNARWLVVCVLTAVLAGCGSATDSITFKPPANYTVAASVGPFMQMWKGPQQSALMLMALPTKIDLAKAVSSSDIKGAQIEKESTIAICGDQPAYYVSMIGDREEFGSAGPAGAAEKRQIDFLATNVNDKTYMAMYIRPVGTPADAGAEAAIHNVCANKSSSQ
ncbi:MAG: hypothetical protein WBG27_01390 [Candidatus Aquilonibacter sp.]|jgi:hypothetical protein